jgi:patatin-like phospholipase/acyl hydrolase
MENTFNVLSIDGGGVRGIIAARILEEIEHQTTKRIAEMFDLVVGSSTGGILALALAKPSQDGVQPQYDARSLKELYKNNAAKIFAPRSGFKKVLPARRRRYSPEGLEEVLTEYFGDAKFSDAITDVMVTAYDTEKRGPVLFRTTDRVLDGRVKEDYLMRDLARATSAAPTYFPPARINRVDEIQEASTLIDGGVFANNPAVCGLVEALRLKHETKDNRKIVIVSVGTGSLTRRYLYEQVAKWGLVDWARRILDICFDGVADLVHDQMRYLMNSGTHIGEYFRLQAPLQEPSDDLDNTSTENLRKLENTAGEILDNHKDDIGRIVRILVSKGSSSRENSQSAI